MASHLEPYTDVSEDYGAESVIKTIQKFNSLRGTLSRIYSDQGSQLLSAADDLKLAPSRKIDWIPVPAEGKHQKELPEEVKLVWVKFLQRVKEAERSLFRRCVKPANSVSDPSLIVGTMALNSPCVQQRIFNDWLTP